MKSYVRQVVTTAALILVTAINAFPQESGAVRRFGLFVGANDGGQDRVTLRYAISDAERIADVMQEVGGVHPNDAVVLYDPSDSELDRVAQRLGSAIDRAKAESRRVEFVFYYSGHSDEKGLLLGEARYEYDRLKSTIQSVDADVAVAILDSCSSGSFTRLKGGRRVQPFLANDTGEMSGHAFLTSSSDDEASQESDEIGASFFTHYLVSGLLGAADNTRDNRVTLNEVYQYAFAETLSRTAGTFAGPQHPSYDIQLAGAGDLVLTDLTVRDARLELEPGVGGRVFVRDRRGRLVAELEKFQDTSVRLALPPGLYVIELVQGSERIVTSAMVAGDGPTVVGPNDFDRLAMEVNRTRGEIPKKTLNPVMPEGSKAIADPAGAGDAAGTGSTDQSDPWEDWEDWDDDYSDDLEQVFEEIRERALAAVEQARQAVDESHSATQVAASQPYGPAPTRSRYQRTVPFAVDVVPGMRLFPEGPAVSDDKTLHNMQLGLLIGSAGDVEGIQASYILSMSSGHHQGLQFSSVGNLRNGPTEGGQFGGVFNISSGFMQGVQFGGVFNLNDGVFHGVQGAGVFNIVDSEFQGIQSAGVFNIAGGNAQGFQAAGVFNIASGLEGFQAAGVLNVAEDVEGAQASLVNVAESVDGVQMGLVNIAEEVDGFTFGLFNYVRFGVFDFSAVVDDTNSYQLTLQHGTPLLYTVYQAGVFQDPDSDLGPRYSTAVGFGSRVWPGAIFLDLDLLARVEGYGESSETRVAGAFNYADGRVFPSLRVSGGLQFGPKFALVGGVRLDGHLRFLDQPESPSHEGDPAFTFMGEGIDVYPHTFIGLKF